MPTDDDDGGGGGGAVVVVGETTTTTHHVDGSRDIVTVTELQNPDGTATTRTTKRHIPATTVAPVASVGPPAPAAPSANPNASDAAAGVPAAATAAAVAAHEAEREDGGFYEFLGYLSDPVPPSSGAREEATPAPSPAPLATPVAAAATAAATEFSPSSTDVVAPDGPSPAPAMSGPEYPPAAVSPSTVLNAACEGGVRTAQVAPAQAGAGGEGPASPAASQAPAQDAPASTAPFWTRRRKIGAGIGVALVALIAIVAGAVAGAAGKDGDASAPKSTEGPGPADPAAPGAASCAAFVLSIAPDLFPTETSWVLLDASSNATIKEGGPYESGQTKITAGACLPEGSYRLVVMDSEGDGMCCDVGEGKYGATLGEKVLREFGRAEFADEDVVEFEVTAADVAGDSAVSLGSTGSPTSTPTPQPTTGSPTTTPSSSPTPRPTDEPTDEPTTTHPTQDPTAKPTTKRPTPTGPCYDVTVLIRTDVQSGAAAGDVTTWDLREKASGEVKISGGPLGPNRTYTTDICLPAAEYVFSITDSGGNGFGDPDACDGCGYNIVVGDVLVGGASLFFANEEFTFPVPYEEEEWCSSDFLVQVVTDQYPGETSWDVVDESGVTVLSGGPYEKPEAAYTEIACLPDGEYQFTIYDSMSDGLEDPGFYILASSGEVVADSQDDLFGFGSSKSIAFVVSGKTITLNPTSKPTSRPTTRNPTPFPTIRPTSRPTLPPTPPPTSPAVSSAVCSFCSSGVDFPDYAAGTAVDDGESITCQSIKAWSLGVLEGSESCDNYQSFEYLCCEEGSGPLCSFCPSGVTFPDYSPASIGDEPITCQGLVGLALGLFEGSEMCSNVQSATDSCCPSGDSVSTPVSTPPPTRPPTPPPTSTSASVSVCSFCSAGVDFPDYSPGSKDGERITCSGLKKDSLGEVETSATCFVIQTFEEDCCEVGNGPVCAFCSSGVDFPNYVVGTSAAGNTLTCQMIKQSSLGFFEGSEGCTNNQSVEDLCCEEGSGPVCSFCPGGVAFPTLEAASFESGPITCEQLEDLSLGFFEASTGCGNLQSFEDVCCPSGGDSIGAPVTTPVGAPICSFCSSGVVDPTLPVAAIDEEPVTCEELEVISEDASEGSTGCDNIQSFENTCCPRNDDFCQFCKDGLKKPDLDLTKDKLDVFLDIKDKVTCADLAMYLREQDKGSDACKDLDVFEDACC